MFTTKINLLIALLFITLYGQAQNAAAKRTFAVHVGFGSENNIGNPGPFAGISYGKTYGDKLVAKLSATYFNGSVQQMYDNAEEKYTSVFLSPRVGFNLAGTNTSAFRLQLSGGPALKWYHSKELAGNSGYTGPDGTSFLREPVNYSSEQGLVLSVFGGLDFSFRLGKQTHLALFIDTYSREILLEHLMPGLKFTRQF